MYRLEATGSRFCAEDLPSQVRVQAGSRLHFGLSSVGPQSNCCRGGLGVMIDSPRTELVLDRCESFAVEGPYADRVRQSVIHWHRNTITKSEVHASKWVRRIGAGDYSSLPCKLTIRSAATPHVGLGSGTQLALAVALSLDRFFGATGAEPLDLARRAGRGSRSAIGTYGFCMGGLLCDRQATPGDRFTSLKHAVTLPECWRVVVARAVKQTGLSGELERTAFSNIHRTDERTEGRLLSLIDRIIVPAARRADFESFCEGVFQYGRLSGELFASVQGGLYNGDAVSSLVESMRGFGANGVGQSSWGPCVFAWCPDPDAAALLRESLLRAWGNRLEIWQARALNRPASVVCDGAPNEMSIEERR